MENQKMYKIIRGSNRTAKSWSVGFIFDEGTRQEMRDELCSLGNLMSHLKYDNKFKSKDRLIVKISTRKTLEYKIVKD